MPDAIRFLGANEDIGNILVETFVEHGVAFDRDGKLIQPRVKGNPSRIVELLRHALSETERDDVLVVDCEEHPQGRSIGIDEWWRRWETAWFGDAFCKNAFSIWFQPVFDTRASCVMGHECTIRLVSGRTHHQAELIETALARGESHEFEKYARRLAIESGARQSSGAFFIPLSAASIYRPQRCLRSALAAFEDTGMRRSDAVFCVSEGDLIRDVAHVQRIAAFLHDEGCQVALGQVGSTAIQGSKIPDLRPDFLKIDRGLVRNVERPACASAIRKLVDTAERARSRVVAEGVETAQSMENLCLLGVNACRDSCSGVLRRMWWHRASRT